MTALISLGIRALVLLSLAWIGAALLRRRSASIRASVWTAAFAAVLALPIVSMFAPPLRVPILAAEPAPVAAATTPAPTAMQTKTAPAAIATTNGVITVKDVSPKATVETFTAAPPVAAAVMPAVNWAVAPFAALFFVTMVLLARHVASYRRIQDIVDAADDAGDEWATLVDDVRSELRIARPVQARVTEATTVPAVTGVFHPVLLLPAETSEWPIDLRRDVVLHELAHVARRDALSQLLGQIACAVYWFIPLTWYGARRAAALRERASDDVVIEAGVRPSAYARNLLVLAQSSATMPHSPAAMAMAQSRIHERITAILSPAARRGRLSARAALAMLTLMFGATTMVAAIEPGARAVSSRELVSPLTMLPAPAPQLPGVCDGKGLNQSSSSIHEDDGKRRWTVKLSGGDCSVDLRAEGKFEFNADFTDIARIDPNGFFRVDVTERGVRRQLDIEPTNGTLTRTWRVDGRERPYDDDARAWFAAFLIALDRRTAIGVDIRLPILLKQGGVDRVLDETAQMSSDYARSQYYLKLPKAARVTPDESVRLLRQAGSLNRSDYYLSEVVRAYVPNIQDQTVRGALVDLVEKMSSDYYQATSIETIIGDRAPGQAEMDVLVRLVPKMSSDHYKMQVLMKVLKAPSLTAAHRAAIASAAAAIGSDFNAAEVLQALARKGLDDQMRRAFFNAVDRIDSDHYHNTVLSAVLQGPSVTERDLLDVVASSASIDSDHYQADVLTDVARHRAATDRVRTAVLDAGAGLSRTYAEQIRRAAGR